MNNSYSKQILLKSAAGLFVIGFIIFKFLSPRYIGKRFNAERDSEYVLDKLWSYDGGFKIGEGDFVSFSPDTNGYTLKNDTILYKMEPRAKILRINKRFFQMKIESIKSGNTGTYLNIEERLQ